MHSQRKITPSYIENQIFNIGERDAYTESQDKRKIYQIVLPSMDSEKKASFKVSKSGTPSVKRFYSKKKRDTNYVTAQPPTNAMIANPFSINNNKNDIIIKHSRTPAPIATNHRTSPVKKVVKQERVNEQSITFPSSAYHDLYIKGERGMTTNYNGSNSNEDMDANRPLSNIGCLQLPLFDKLMLYQMVKGRKVIASTSLNQLQNSSIKLPNTARASTNVKRRLNLQHAQSSDNKDAFFMFTSTISNFKSKSQESRYYMTQKELHSLRGMLSNAKNVEEIEAKIVENVFGIISI